MSSYPFLIKKVGILVCSIVLYYLANASLLHPWIAMITSDLGIPYLLGILSNKQLPGDKDYNKVVNCNRLLEYMDIISNALYSLYIQVPPEVISIDAQVEFDSNHHSNVLLYLLVQVHHCQRDRHVIEQRYRVKHTKVPR